MVNLLANVGFLFLSKYLAGHGFLILIVMDSIFPWLLEYFFCVNWFKHLLSVKSENVTSTQAQVVTYTAVNNVVTVTVTPNEVNDSTVSSPVNDRPRGKSVKESHLSTQSELQNKPEDTTKDTAIDPTVSDVKNRNPIMKRMNWLISSAHIASEKDIDKANDEVKERKGNASGVKKWIFAFNNSLLFKTKPMSARKASTEGDVLGQVDVLERPLRSNNHQETKELDQSVLEDPGNRMPASSKSPELQKNGDSDKIVQDYLRYENLVSEINSLKDGVSQPTATFVFVVMGFVILVALLIISVLLLGQRSSDALIIVFTSIGLFIAGELFTNYFSHELFFRYEFPSFYNKDVNDGSTLINESNPDIECFDAPVLTLLNANPRVKGLDGKIKDIEKYIQGLAGDSRIKLRQLMKQKNFKLLPHHKNQIKDPLGVCKHDQIHPTESRGNEATDGVNPTALSPEARKNNIIKLFGFRNPLSQVSQKKWGASSSNA